MAQTPAALHRWFWRLSHAKWICRVLLLLAVINEKHDPTMLYKIAVAADENQAVNISQHDDVTEGGTRTSKKNKTTLQPCVALATYDTPGFLF
jgi:hypothetical protein